MDKQPTQYQLQAQVKKEDAPKLLKIPKSESPYTWIRLPRHKWPKSWSNIEEPPVLVRKKIVRTSTCLSLVGKDSSKKFHWDLDGESTELGMSVDSPNTRIVLIGICR